MSQNVQKPAVFLDRDGTVVVDRGYLDNVEGIELFPGASEALKQLTAAGYLLVLITNQSGVGRGYFDLAVVKQQHQRLHELLEPAGVRFAAIEICPHSPDEACSCRKPSAELLERAAAKLNIDLSASYMIGDKVSDVKAGHAAGCTSILLGADQPEADYCTRTLAEAAEWIIRR